MPRGIICSLVQPLQHRRPVSARRAFVSILSACILGLVTRRSTALLRSRRHRPTTVSLSALRSPAGRIDIAVHAPWKGRVARRTFTYLSLRICPLRQVARSAIKGGFRYTRDQGGAESPLDPETMLALKISPADLVAIGERRTCCGRFADHWSEELEPAQDPDR